MKKMMKILMVMLMVVAFVGIKSAYATPMLELSSGLTTIQISDGGAGDIASEAGAVGYMGLIGGFDLNVVLGATKPLIGSPIFPKLDLFSVNISSSGSGGTLTIRFSETDFGPLSGEWLRSWVGGGTDGSVEILTYLDTNNDDAPWSGGTLLADLGPFTGDPFAGSSSTWVGAPASPFSLGIEAVVTHGSGKGVTTSFNAGLGVPEPSTLILLGSGLIGLGYYARRKALKK